MGLETNKVTYKKSWHLLRLKELCTRISDGTHFTPEYVEKGIPFISVKDIYNDTVHFDKCRYITHEAHDELIKRCFPEKDDVLITKSGTIGRMALVPEKPEFSLFVSVALLKNKKELIHSKFLKYCLENFLNHINISQDIKGGLLKNFHLEDIRETVIPKVTLEEQQLIISKIEELLSDLDNGKQQLQIAQQQLKVYRQSLLKWAFEGKLTHRNIKEGELPKGWKLTNLGIVLNNIEAGKSFKCDERTPSLDEVGVLKVSAVTWQIFNEFESKTVIGIDRINKDYFVKRDDFLFSRANTLDLIGAVVIVNSIERNLMLSDKTLRFRFNSDVIPKYILYYLRSRKGRKEIQRLSTGNQESMRNIGQARIKQIEFPYCTKEEQQLVVNELESKLTVCDKIEETISQSLLQAETLRQSILKKAFEGKLV